MEFGLLNMLFAVGLTFLLTVGLMYSVSENDNPTPTQIKNRIISHLKLDVPVFKKKQIPNSLKLIPITTPGSRFTKWNV